jgi:threonine/homoserine/homoserine lactone efflux protein
MPEISQIALSNAGPLLPQLTLLDFLFTVVTVVVMGIAGVTGSEVGRLLSYPPRGLRGMNYTDGRISRAPGLRLIHDEAR